jgi:WD40-like Beta Propeller Repeat
MYSAFVGVISPGQDGMRRAVVPFNWSVVPVFFRVRASQRRLRPLCHLVRQQTWQEIIFVARRSFPGWKICRVHLRQGARPTLWLRQIAAESAVQLLPGSQMDYNWVGFSPDGEYIYFQETLGDYDYTYTVPTLGGTPRLVTKNAMNHGVGISPDGKKIAFICHPDTINSSLNVALSDGSG